MPKWLKFANDVAKAIVPGVAQVEAIAATIPTLKGAQKQDAVVQLVKASLMAVEGVTEKDLLNDPDVENATRGVIDAVVALQNVLAKHA